VRPVDPREALDRLLRAIGVALVMITSRRRLAGLDVTHRLGESSTSTSGSVASATASQSSRLPIAVHVAGM
jgi:hypothetical protein